MAADRAASADGYAGKPRVDDRRVISGIVHVLKSAGAGSMRRPTMGRARRSTTALSAGPPRASGSISSMRLRSAGGPPAQVLIDSSAVKAHRSASGGKRMARPVRKWFVSVWSEQSAKTYPAFRHARWPRWRSARPGPHKGDGVERHFTP